MPPRARPPASTPPIGDADDAVLGDFVAGDEPLPEETVETQLRRQALFRALGGLPDREREVVALRYGIDGHEPRTLEEIGRRLGITRERVRQIELDSLRRLAVAHEMQSVADRWGDPWSEPPLARATVNGLRRSAAATHQARKYSSSAGATCRSSRSARVSSWRTRSRVIPSSTPTCSSVRRRPVEPESEHEDSLEPGLELRECACELGRAQPGAVSASGSIGDVSSIRSLSRSRRRRRASRG